MNSVSVTSYSVSNKEICQRAEVSVTERRDKNQSKGQEDVLTEGRLMNAMKYLLTKRIKELQKKKNAKKSNCDEKTASKAGLTY